MALLSFLNNSYKASTSLTVTAKIQENISDGQLNSDQTKHKAKFGTCGKKKKGRERKLKRGF